jgi:hypothetical protein
MQTGTITSRPILRAFHNMKLFRNSDPISQKTQRVSITDTKLLLSRKIILLTMRTTLAQRITYGRNLGFLDRSRYFFFQVAPQLYSRGCVNPVPDPLLLRISGSYRNRTRTSGSVARNSDHQTTEASGYISQNSTKSQHNQ